MYYGPPMYQNPLYATGSTYGSNFRSGNNEQVLESIVNGIKGEAAAIDLYSRLAESAPDQKHKNTFLRVLEEEKGHFEQFTNFYSTLTGKPPVYEIDEIAFHSYQDGLEKAYKAKVDNYEIYRQIYLLTQHSPLQNVFARACNDEASHASQIRLLASNQESRIELKDYGKEPFVVNIDEATKQNNTFRTALWTGNHLQVTLMSIGVGDDIGLEIHPDVDQFLRVEEGEGFVQMGDRKDRLDFEARVYDDYAIMLPAGKWHNVTNTGNKPLKLYSIYAPPEHPFGTVHETKADAVAAEEM
ncbi:cupin domain-containing protein [Halobacillus sp. BBL2006]|uniref:cupin domain-containing protein n=1 Tax=Halobacillus sp. BBL2006 TaxID=1543706 RepID=UPI000542E065|nr:cupin domain-containing protein [Halobacillus sp. BBL2006]KHE69542.1 cupin [Halobacillus sp. BBL2006]